MSTQNIIELIPRSDNQYKINLHTHSKLSDGNYTPEELKKLYMAEGYSALAYTDHRECIPHPELTDENFVALTGVELDFTLSDANGVLGCVHLNGLARDPMTRRSYEKLPLDYDVVNNTVASLKNDNFFVTLNHPVWSNMSCDDLCKIKGMDAVEIVNSIGVMFNNYADDTPLYEYYLRKGGNAVCVAGDDTHKIFEDGTPFMEYYRSFTMVCAKELSYGNIVGALDSGRCYCSTGPQFHAVWIEGDKLCVECSPVFGVYLHSKYMNLKTQDVRKTDCITYTELDISAIREKSPYIWIQLRDLAGGKAWSVPYFF